MRKSDSIDGHHGLLGQKKKYCFLFSAFYLSRHVTTAFVQLQFFAIDLQLHENLRVGHKIID